MPVKGWGIAGFLGVMMMMGATLVHGGDLGPQKFERIVIDADFPGGYQVEVADVNGDKKPDIVALGGSTLAWYENPTWIKRVVSTAKQTPDIISSATIDLDGDGKAEIAIAYDFSMNEPKRGKLLLAIAGAKVDDPWTFQPIVNANKVPPLKAGESAGKALEASATQPIAVPSIHRLRWGCLIGMTVVEKDSVSFKKKPELIVAPLFGPTATPPLFDQEPASLMVFLTGTNPKAGQWTPRVIAMAPVVHAIEVLKIAGEERSVVLAASNLGVTRIVPGLAIPSPAALTEHLVDGAHGSPPRKGASEVHQGRLKDGRKFLATVEPWHGTEVVVYLSESTRFGPRLVIDSTLKDGHALWVADVDGDGDDEVFAGYRGGEGGVLMFDFNGQTWDRTVLDPAVTAQDLRGGDIDGDGSPDIVAIGGKSHNVVWYRPIRPAK